MRRFFVLVPLFALAGCLTSSAPSVATWTVEFAPEGASSAASAAPKGPSLESDDGGIQLDDELEF